MEVKKLMLDVGAYNGEDGLAFYRRGNYIVHAFEALPNFYKDINERTKDYKGYHIHHNAICLHDGMVDFHICMMGGASSILPFKPGDELIKHWGPERIDIHDSGYTVSVPSLRLDTFLEREGLTETIIDYIHVDAQGADLDVLKSLGKYIGNIKGGVVETALNQDRSIYRGQENTLSNMLVFLEKNNFRITKVVPNEDTHCEYNVYFENRNW